MCVEARLRREAWRAGKGRRWRQQRWWFERCIPPPPPQKRVALAKTTHTRDCAACMYERFGTGTCYIQTQQHWRGKQQQHTGPKSWRPSLFEQRGKRAPRGPAQHERTSLIAACHGSSPLVDEAATDTCLYVITQVMGVMGGFVRGGAHCTKHQKKRRAAVCVFAQPPSTNGNWAP